MVQLVKVKAKETWGEAKPAGEPNAVPKWLQICKQCLGFAMRAFVTESKGWDAYIIGTIMMAYMKHFLPDSIRADDAACEMHR